VKPEPKVVKPKVPEPEADKLPTAKDVMKDIPVPKDANPVPPQDVPDVVPVQKVNEPTE